MITPVGPTDALRIVDLQVAIQAAHGMLAGTNSGEAVENAQAATENSDDESRVTAHMLAQLLYSFGKGIEERAMAKSKG